MGGSPAYASTASPNTAANDEIPSVAALFTKSRVFWTAFFRTFRTLDRVINLTAMHRHFPGGVWPAPQNLIHVV
jgi:hypothetical protein